MQKQSSGQKTMLLQKFDRSRQQAITPTRINKAQRGEQVAAVVALADRVLKAAGTKPKANGGVREFDFASGPGSLGDILRRALIAKGQR